MILALVGLVHAEGVASVGGVLGDLSQVLTDLEAGQIQITHLSMGIVFDDGVGYSVPVTLGEGEDIRIVGFGDRERIANLDIYVFDERGELVAQDDSTDNLPIVPLIAPRAGTYDVRVVIADPMPEWDLGFFAVAMGYESAIPPVSAVEPFEVTLAAAQVLEENGYQFIHAQWLTLSPEETGFVQTRVDDWVMCTAYAGSSPSRTKKLDIYAADPMDQPRGHDRRHGALGMVDFVPVPPGEWMFALNARKLQRGFTDTHAVVVVGCSDEF